MDAQVLLEFVPEFELVVGEFFGGVAGEEFGDVFRVFAVGGGKPRAAFGPDFLLVAPVFIGGGAEEDFVVLGDEVFERAEDGGGFAPEGGALKGGEEFFLVFGAVLPLEKSLVDLLASLRALMFVEHGHLSTEAEFGGVGANDAGEKGVEGAKKEARHSLDEKGEEFAVVAAGELREGGVKRVVGGAGEFFCGLVGLGSLGEFFEDFFEEFSCGLAGEGDGDDALGLGCFSGEEIASEEGQVTVGELEGFTRTSRGADEFVIHAGLGVGFLNREER